MRAQLIKNRAMAWDQAKLLAWLLHRHVHEYFDVDGRPVGEGRSQAFAQVETKFRTCPYAGSRYQHEKPMNASALQSILPEWQKSLALLAWLSQRYQAYYHKPVSSYYDLALISGMGVFLTDYMVIRQSSPLASEAIPVWMSGLYKVSLGFQQATFLAMMQAYFDGNGKDQDGLPDSKGFYAYLEAQELLIGSEEVCGGSEEMISRAYEAMKGLAANPAAGSQLSFADGLQIEWDAYDLFSFHSSNLWRKAILFVIQMQGFGIDLSGLGLPIALAGEINAYLKSSLNGLLAAQSGLVVEIAQITLAESGHSLEEWLGLQAAFLQEIGYQPSRDNKTDKLADQIVAQLASRFALSAYQPALLTVVRAQMAKYGAFEAAVLSALDSHLAAILSALGCAVSGQALQAKDLSVVCGKTLRDWPEVMKR